MWTASSGTDPKLASVLEVVAGVVRSCSCPAGAYGDPRCKHAADRMAGAAEMHRLGYFPKCGLGL